MKKTIIISLLLISLLILAGCSQSIANIKNEDYLGKKVSIKGTVQSSLKIGDLSGYTLKDESGESIFVSSNNLPSNGETNHVRGTVKQIPILKTYYIETK